MHISQQFDNFINFACGSKLPENFFGRGGNEIKNKLLEKVRCTIFSYIL